MNRGDVQGLLFSGYSRQPASALILLRFGDGRANAWLRRTLPQITTGALFERSEPFRFNVAFTFAGLQKLGLPSPTLRGFSREFQQGMAHPERAQALGDAGSNHPSTWQFSDAGERGVDAAVLVYAVSAAELAAKLEVERDALARFGIELDVLETYLPRDGREHFGFRMGVSEPFVRGLHRGRARKPRLATGEFVLGYADGVGDRTSGPLAPKLRTTREPLARAGGRQTVSFGFNGSYLVIRKLEQYVESFESFLALAEQTGVSRELCAAKLIGRWPNGASLALHPEHEPASAEPELRLDYDRLDPRGYGCPIGAHVRRANPGANMIAGGESDRHRLLRRGRLYGPERGADGAAGERGMLFVALNADLERQFEYVQGLLLAGKKFAGARDEADPLLGGAASGEPRRFTLPGAPVRKRLSGLPELVRARGGLYGFLPSLRALGYLADLSEKRAGP